MPSSDEFDEAVAIYEAARAKFRALQAKSRSRLRENVDYEALELARWEMFKTRARLIRLFREKDRKERPK